MRSAKWVLLLVIITIAKIWIVATEENDDWDSCEDDGDPCYLREAREGLWDPELEGIELPFKFKLEYMTGEQDVGPVEYVTIPPPTTTTSAPTTTSRPTTTTSTPTTSSSTTRPTTTSTTATTSSLPPTTTTMATTSTTTPPPPHLKPFYDEKIVPDIIPNPPKDIMKIEFYIGRTNTWYLPVDLTGEVEFDVATASVSPDTPFWVTMTEAKPYINLMFDIDSSSGGSYLIVLLIITGQDPQVGGSVYQLQQYSENQCKPGSGRHRFVYLVYEQPVVFDGDKLFASSNNRENFDMKKFAQDNGLGDPVFGTFFYVKCKEQ